MPRNGLNDVRVSAEDVGVVAWLRFFVRHKRGLIARLRPHLDSEPLAKALAEVRLPPQRGQRRTEAQHLTVCVSCMCSFCLAAS
jgi:hypothetical protein